LGLERKLSAEEQQVVRAWLRGLNPACEEIYLSICRVADADEFPGRARLIGHCIRELRIRLLAHFVGEQKDPVDYPAKLRAIAKRLELEGVITIDPAANAETPAETPITIGSDTATMIRELIGKSEAKTAKLVDQMAELLRRIRLESDGPESNLKTIAADFKTVTETQGIAHSPKTDAELIDKDFIARLAAFEGYLHNFATARRFVARLEPLDDILDEANRPAS
jgi:hypothetical protein